MPALDDNVSAFLAGAREKLDGRSAFLKGALTATPSNISAFLSGNIAVSSSISAFIPGSGVASSSIHCYIGDMDLVVRSSVHVSMGGIGAMAEYSYVIFEDSTAATTKYFRVIAQGYNDGELEKAESMERTIGGGIDHSMGAIYTSWNPLIRVRETETESGYGDLADLQYFYSLNNPNGSPSNIITFTDHHGNPYDVRIHGKFQKDLMGVKIEGENAWYLVKLTLIKV